MSNLSNVEIHYEKVYNETIFIAFVSTYSTQLRDPNCYNPIYRRGEKKGDNFGLLAFLDVVYKIITITIKNRLEKQVEPVLGECS